MQPAVFLDRDNTIIHNDTDLGDPSKVVLIQGAASAIASLNGLDFRVVVVSNQGGVARGKFTPADVDLCNQRVCELVKQISDGVIDRFYYCPYHPEGTVAEYRQEHPWRKPQPGMLLQAAKDLKLDLSQSWMIGDAMRDIEAGKAAGCRTILLHPEARERPPLDAGLIDDLPAEIGEDPNAVRPDFTARNLVDAVKIVAQQRKPGVVEELRSLTPNRPPRVQRKTPAPPPAPPPAAMAPANAPAPAATQTHADQQLMRQLLHELRQQRTTPQTPTAAPPPVMPPRDWTPLSIMGMTLLMIAALCLVGGLIMGANDPESFLRWIAVGIMVQLGAIALLLLRR